MNPPSDRDRSFEAARHPQREAGREAFLSGPFEEDLKQLAPNPGRILVLGGGDGLEAAALARIFPAAVAVSMDLSLPELLLSRQTFPAGLFVRGDWDHPPFAVGTFDLVVFFASLHHSIHLEATLSSVYRLLRPGGAVYAAHEPMSSLLLGPFQRRRMARIAREEEGIETSPSHREYLRALRRAGFREIALAPCRLNEIRLSDPLARFEDVARRRNPWPEKLAAWCWRRMSCCSESRRRSFLFLVQRLAFGLFGITLQGRK